MMKIWLDDIREAPEGWIQCKSPMTVIDLVRSNKVEEISLDFDLGLLEPSGIIVLDWIEVQVYTGFPIDIPIMHVHSSNPVGRKRMQLLINKINVLKPSG